MGGARELRGQVWGGGSGVTQEGRGETELARRGQGFSHWVNTGLEKSPFLGSEKGVGGRGQGQGPPRTTSKRVGEALWFTRAGPAPQMCPHPHLPPAACPRTLPRPSRVHSGPQSLSWPSIPFLCTGPSKLRAGKWAVVAGPPLHLRTPEEKS